MTDYSALILALIVAGLVLIAAEVLLPGLILGTIGFLCLVASVALVFVNYGTVAGIVATFIVSILTLVGFVLWLYVFPRSFIGRRVMLLTPNSEKSAAAKNQSLVGLEGEALTPLRPSGTARIDGRRVDVSAVGDFLEEGAKLEVVSADGLRVAVRRKVLLEQSPE
jgi:membrane-bound serine protease (ClpP class)